MRKCIEDGLIGKPYVIESRVEGSRGLPSGWRETKALGGGMMYDWGVHLIDQLMYMYDESGYSPVLYDGYYDNRMPIYLIGMIDDDMKNRRYESRTIIISAVTMDNMNKYFDVSKSNTMTSFDAFYIIKDVQGNLYKCNGIPPHNFGALNGMQLNITYLVGSRVIDSVQVI